MADWINNYKTRNLFDGSVQMDWCIAPVMGKVRQVTLQMNNGKSFEYACRYDAAEGSVAIVGREFPYDVISADESPNTGAMGIVTAVLPKLTIKKRTAVEIDFVFNRNPQNTDLKQCADFLSGGCNFYNKTLLADAPIRPITYHIQKILTAASLISHKESVDEKLLELAKSTILEKKIIDPKMLTAWFAPFDPRIGINDIHIPDPDIEEVLAKIEDEVGDDAKWYDDGILDEDSDYAEEFISLEIVNNHVNKYSHLGAISIMVRGGFNNLLEAYLSVNPPIEDFLTDARDILQDIGHAETYALL